MRNKNKNLRLTEIVLIMGHDITVHPQVRVTEH